MQIMMNFNNPQTNFGMAFKIKPEAMRNFADYTGILNSKCAERGFDQFLKEQSKIKLYDVKFNPADNSVKVIEKVTGSVLDTYDMTHTTGISRLNSSALGRLLRALFNPKDFLPNNILLAGERAKELERNTIKINEYQKKLNGFKR